MVVANARLKAQVAVRGAALAGRLVARTVVVVLQLAFFANRALADFRFVHFLGSASRGVAWISDGANR